MFLLLLINICMKIKHEKQEPVDNFSEIHYKIVG